MKKMIAAGILSLAFPACAASGGDRPSLIAFEPPPAQSGGALEARWRRLDDEKRRAIESFLVVRLGLSATGSIRLTGVYSESGGSDGADKTLFQFQQLDLSGTRLFWSVLVDPDAATAKVLYHVDGAFMTGEPVPLTGNHDSKL